MKIYVFGKVGCARCESTKRKVTHLLDKWGVGDRIGMDFVDMGTVEGLAEGSFYDVSQVPVTIITQGQDEVARWDGIVPASEELRARLDVGIVAASGEGAVGE